MKQTGLMSLKARGEGKTSMRNDAAQVSKSQHPSNKDPEDVTPGPQYQQGNHIKIRLPKALESNSHKTGERVAHLAVGHHVKNADGSTTFHMHELDGEPVSQDNMEPTEGEQSSDGDTDE